MMAQDYNPVRDYYNSSDADIFYDVCWGDGSGDYIHIGIFESPSESIPSASRRTVTVMAEKLKLESSKTVLDAGAGYGGSGRELARMYGFHVTCLNLSEVENERNKQVTAKSGLDKLVKVVEGTYENIPFPDGSFDVVWSNDALLHSVDREKAMREIRRVLKPNGQVVLTDLMASDGRDTASMQPILDRLNLVSLANPKWYTSQLESLGGTATFQDLSSSMVTHYTRALEMLVEKRPMLTGKISEAFMAKMETGLQHWVEGGKRGDLVWGIIHAQF